MKKIEKSICNEYSHSISQEIYIKKHSKRSQGTPCYDYHCLKQILSKFKSKLDEVSILNHSSIHLVKVSIMNCPGRTTPITCKANIRNIHIRSKLLYRCKNVRTSTKFVLGFLLPSSVLTWLWRPCH